MNMKNLREEMDNPFCFAVELPDELGARVDCKYHNPEITKEIENLRNYRMENSKIEKLRRIAIPSGGKRLPKGHIFFKTDYDNVPYIRATDIKHGKVDVENSERINYQVHKKIEKYQLRKGDVVITIVGINTGETGILKDDVQICNFNENIARISVTNESVLNEFINSFLNSDLGRIQTHRLSVGSTKDKLSLKNCKEVDILIPYDNKTGRFDISEQQRIVGEVNIYDKKAEGSIQCYRDRIDELRGLVPEKLRIKLSVEPKKEQTFSCNLLYDPKERIDALYNNPYRGELIVALKRYSHKELSKIATIEKREEILPSEFYRLIDLDDISEDLGEVINIKEVSKLGSTKVVLRKGRILVSRLEPDKGKAILVDDKTDGCVGSSELVPLKLVSEQVLSEYLWIILRSDYVLKQWKYAITGCSRERIGKRELENAIIPIPNRQVQEEIIKEYAEILKQAKDSLDEYKLNKRKAMDTLVSLLVTVPYGSEEIRARNEVNNHHPRVVACQCGSFVSLVKSSNCSA